VCLGHETSTHYILESARCRFHKKHTGTHYIKLVVLHPVGSVGHIVHPGRKTSTHYFPCLGGTGMDSIKSVSGHVTLNLFFFASGGTCGSHSAFQCVQGVKRQHTIFHFRVGPVRFP
jgi:hypothetical protein